MKNYVIALSMATLLSPPLACMETGKIIVDPIVSQEVSIKQTLETLQATYARLKQTNHKNRQILWQHYGPQQKKWPLNLFSSMPEKINVMMQEIAMHCRCDATPQDVLLHVCKHSEQLTSQDLLHCIAALQEAGADLIKGEILHKAADYNASNLAYVALACGMAINGYDEYNYVFSPLHRAAASGSCEVARILILAGADLDIVYCNVFSFDDSRETALHMAVRAGKEQMVKLLLDAHAKVNIKDKDRNTPLDYAQKNSEIYNLLRACNAKHGTELPYNSYPE